MGFFFFFRASLVLATGAHLGSSAHLSSPRSHCGHRISRMEHSTATCVHTSERWELWLPVWNSCYSQWQLHKGRKEEVIQSCQLSDSHRAKHAGANKIQCTRYNGRFAKHGGHRPVLSCSEDIVCPGLKLEALFILTLKNICTYTHSDASAIPPVVKDILGNPGVSLPRTLKCPGTKLGDCCKMWDFFFKKSSTPEPLMVVQ